MRLQCGKQDVCVGRARGISRLSQLGKMDHLWRPQPPTLQSDTDYTIASSATEENGGSGHMQNNNIHAQHVCACASPAAGSEENRRTCHVLVPCAAYSTPTQL